MPNSVNISRNMHRIFFNNPRVGRFCYTSSTTARTIAQRCYKDSTNSARRPLTRISSCGCGAESETMKKTYRLKRFYAIAYSLYAILAVIYVFLKLEGILTIWGTQGNIIVAGMTLIGIIAFYNVLLEKLIISESGIEYKGFLQNFFLSWNQVEEIPARLSFKVLIGKSSDGRKRNISLYLFKDNPINSELGQQIKRYAPHLFEKENKQSV